MNNGNRSFEIMNRFLRYWDMIVESLSESVYQKLISVISSKRCDGSSTQVQGAIRLEGRTNPIFADRFVNDQFDTEILV